MEIRIQPADSPDALALCRELWQRLAELTGADGSASFDASQMAGDRCCFLVAYEGETPVGCAALRPFDARTAEVKRVYSKRPGAGTQLFHALEREAVRRGYTSLVLETRRINKNAAAFYQKMGCREMENYGAYKGRSDAVCFGKNLPAVKDLPAADENDQRHRAQTEQNEVKA